MANNFHNIVFLTCSLLILFTVRVSKCSPVTPAATGGPLPNVESSRSTGASTDGPLPTTSSSHYTVAQPGGPLPTTPRSHFRQVIPLVLNKLDVSEMNDPCEPNPCLHRGQCHLNPSHKPEKYMCACPLGRMGQICNETVSDCDRLDCITLSDCLSTPDGALCVCDSGDFGHFCSLSMRKTTEWQKIRKSLLVQTVVISEAILFGMAVVFALVFVSCLIHCCRVAKLHQTHMEMYKDVVDNGKVPTEVPPGWPEVSRDLIKTTICCGKSSLPVNYGISITKSEQKNKKKDKDKEKKSKESKKGKKDRDDQNDNYHRDFSDGNSDTDSVLYDRRRTTDSRRRVSRHAR
ncbi:agrin-like isoform X2 [Dreissena polymorpha]|uniref:agrin-like isoform X2 n=1 Tax=Dreissena polymorpha TaxID=45954 RepID=UPI00226477A6|nr:agrin-like isoform X2 [Dreissena polymorpha]